MKYKRDKGKHELLERQKMNLRSKNASKASQLLTRLEKNACGTLTIDGKDENGVVTHEPVEMTAGQIKSAEIFLRKTMPDLSSVDSTTIIKDERSFAEIREESIGFLVKAGMSEAEADIALKNMAKEITH